MINYQLRFFLNFIKGNWIKILVIITSSIVLYYQQFIPDDVNAYPLLESKVIYGKYIYIVGYPSNIKLIPSDKPKTIKDGLLFQYNYNPIRIILIIFSVIGLIMVIVFSFIDDDSVDWSLEKIRKQTLGSFIHCDFENGFYHYTIFDRLIKKDQRQENDIKYWLGGISKVSELNSRPVYKSVSRKRDDVLKKLFND